MYYYSDRKKDGEIPDPNKKFDPNSTVPKAERDAQLLCMKVEALLVRCMKNVVPYQTVMKYYTMPERSLYDRNGRILEYI